MKNVKFLSNFYLIWFSNICYSSVSVEGRFSALTFLKNEENYEIVDTDEIPHRKYDIVILACPADINVPKNKVLNESSMTKNILLVEQVYKAEDEVQDDKIKICEKEFSPSVIKNDETDFYEIGYEVSETSLQIHFNDELLQNPPASSPMEDWGLESGSQVQRTMNKFVKLGNFENIFWYVVMFTLYQPSRSLKTSIHKVSQNKYVGSFKECKDLKFGRNFIDDENIDEIYDTEFQKKILYEYQMPQELSKHERNTLHFVKHQLTPINDFDAYGKRITTCTHLNVIPMWNTITVWKKVEKIVKKLAEHVNIEIATGTMGQLNLPEHKYPHESKDFYLNRTPVPGIVWKLVEQSIPIHDQGILRYSILIVSNNYFSKLVLSQKFCGINVCDELGWNVANSNSKTGFTYCCRVRKEMLATFGITYFSESNDLNLKDLNYGFDEEDDIVMIDFLKVLDKMNVDD